MAGHRSRPRAGQRGDDRHPFVAARLADHPGLLAELRTARSWGVPLSVLRGVRRTGDRWTEHDYSTAVALTLYEQSLCTGCGHPIHETQDPGADPNNPDGTHHYEVSSPVRCHACTALAIKTKAYEEAEQPGALRFSARRIDEDPSEHDQPDP